MINKKKMFLTIGSISASLISISLVVSCSQNGIQEYVNQNGKNFVNTFGSEKAKNVFASSIINYNTFQKIFNNQNFVLAKGYELIFGNKLITDDNTGKLFTNFYYKYNNGSTIYTPAPIPKTIMVNGKEEILLDDKGKPILIDVFSVLDLPEAFKIVTPEIQKLFSAEFDKFKDRQIPLNQKGIEVLGDKNFSINLFNFTDETADNYIGKLIDLTSIGLSTNFQISDFNFLNYDGKSMTLNIVLENTLTKTKKGASIPNENLINISLNKAKF
ncbi:MAG: hypothetical protein ACRDAW_00980 [Metamycoplasmataceae bacterium]